MRRLLDVGKRERPIACMLLRHLGASLGGHLISSVREKTAVGDKISTGRPAVLSVTCEIGKQPVR